MMIELQKSIEPKTRRNFEEFLTSGHTARVYEKGQLVFFSKKTGLLPLLEYLDKFTPPTKKTVVIFDKVVGNSAALLAILAGCSQVYSPLGSKLAVETLKKHDISYHFLEIVPYILRSDGRGMCPMEKLSLNKEPAEFYRLLKSQKNPEKQK
ncbi:DUF1893 domain-containing protein [Chloroflexota bacterium]